MSLRQYAGLHHDLADVVQAAGGWLLVQEAVAQRTAVGDETGQQLGVRAVTDPSDRGERQPDLGESVDQRLQLGRDRAVRPGQQVSDLVREDAVGTSPVPVRVSRAAALPAGVVDVVSGARAADSGAVVVPGDERLCAVAASTFGRGPQDRGVAGLADGPDRPVGHYRKVPLAAAAGHPWSLVAGVAGVADRCTGADPLAGARPQREHVVSGPR